MRTLSQITLNTVPSLTTLKSTLSLRSLKKTLERTLSLRALKRILSLRNLNRTLSNIDTTMYAIAEVIEKVVEIKNNKGNMGWRKSRFRVTAH